MNAYRVTVTDPSGEVVFVGSVTEKDRMVLVTSVNDIAHLELTATADVAYLERT